MAEAEGGHKFDHVVSVMFENRTFDNLLGRLYQPGEVLSFEGVIGKYTGHVPDLDPKTATGQQADDYMNDRTARIWPGLVTHPS